MQERKCLSGVLQEYSLWRVWSKLQNEITEIKDSSAKFKSTQKGKEWNFIK
jgi:hypothetical protein